MDGLKDRIPAKSGDFAVPIIVNNNNFAKGADGEPTLLSFDDARTLFHEFGHGLHGMLSDVNYGRLAGTNVLKVYLVTIIYILIHILTHTLIHTYTHTYTHTYIYSYIHILIHAYTPHIF